jgi:flagellar biosynthesis protein FlhF
MQLIPFVAESAIDAVNQIRAQLGPEAVVVNVRKLPVDGLARLWQKPRIEVLAYKPELVAPPEVIPPLSTAPGQREPFPFEATVPPLGSVIPAEFSDFKFPTRESGSGGWKIASVLESSGFLPVFAQRVLDQIQTMHGQTSPPPFSEEIQLAQGVLAKMWRKARPLRDGTARPHVLVGPAGVGKTTCLCKWLTQTVLMEGSPAQVWRLDGTTANTAESLTIYCDVLGVPIERSWQNAAEAPDEVISFIDFPGLDWRDSRALGEFGRELTRHSSPRIHLVLNAAYEVPTLLAQARAFAVLPVEDLIFTHLDEETRWGKLWQLVMGTNFPVRFLSAGQNIPGDFSVASPEKILSRQFSR